MERWIMVELQRTGESSLLCMLLDRRCRVFISRLSPHEIVHPAHSSPERSRKTTL